MSIRNDLFLSIGSVLAVVVALTAAAGAQGKSQEELRKPFIGTWRLVSIEGGPQSTASRGAHPTGVIMYDQHGLMNVQIMPDRPGRNGPARQRRSRRSRRFGATPRTGAPNDR